MEIKTILVSFLMVALGIAVALAGFAAEKLKPKKSQLKVVYLGLDPQCNYPSSPVMRIAIAAVMALVIARAIITAITGGCCSCCRPIPNASKFARVCILISWITSIVAVILFILGAILSGEKGVEIDVNDVFYCYTLRPGVFSAAGVVGLASVLLGLVYYFLYVLARSHAAEKLGADLELEKPRVTDVKKQQSCDGMKPQVPLQKN